LELSPADPEILYAGRYNNHVYRSDNARDDVPLWYNLTSGLPGAGDIYDIECHPENPDIVYLSKNNKIYRSENKGQSWEDISGTLPDVPFTSIAYYKNAHEGLYVSSDIGVYYKDAFMYDWVMFSNGLPIDASINEVEIYLDPIDPAADIIRAGTYGRGMWESDMYHMQPGANFMASETMIPPGCAIYFTDLSSGVPTEWQWTFEGATPSTSEDRNPSGITYNDPGTYMVKLMVLNEAGSDSITMVDYITVSQDVMPDVAFGADRTSVCINGIVHFTDSTRYCPDNWEWSFSPSTVAFVEGTTANSQHPVVEFQMEGDYTVTLTATNTNGQNSLVKTDFIQAGGYTLPFEEDFEMASFSDRSWTVVNSDFNSTWSLFDIEGTNNKAAQMKFYGYFNLAARDQLISPFLNFTGMDQVYLRFDYAYAQRFNQKDSLVVYISDDCGDSWVRIWANGPDGSGVFATSEPTPYEFIPIEVENWCGAGWGAECVFLDLSPWAGESGIQIMFEGFNSLGNNLYIDNVVVSNTTFTGEIQTSMSGFAIYPNPGNGLFRVVVNEAEGPNSLEFFNTQGQLIFSRELDSGSYAMTVDLRHLPAGVYISRLLSNSGVQIKKVIIE
jgi:PKD repeat protein